MKTNKNHFKKEIIFNNQIELQNYIIERFVKFGDKVKYNFKLIIL